MPSPEPFRVFTRKLEELGLRYMVTGGVAAIYYGELVGKHGLLTEWSRANSLDTD